MSKRHRGRRTAKIGNCAPSKVVGFPALVVQLAEPLRQTDVQRRRGAAEWIVASGFPGSVDHVERLLCVLEGGWPSTELCTSASVAPDDATRKRVLAYARGLGVDAVLLAEVAAAIGPLDVAFIEGHSDTRARTARVSDRLPGGDGLQEWLGGRWAEEEIANALRGPRALSDDAAYSMITRVLREAGIPGGIPSELRAT